MKTTTYILIVTLGGQLVWSQIEQGHKSGNIIGFTQPAGIWHPEEHVEQGVYSSVPLLTLQPCITGKV